MEEQDKSFTIVDKRHGREEGPQGSAEPETADQAPGTASAAAPPEQPEPGHADEGRRLASELPAMDFSTFLISLSTSALYHLGLVAEQEGAPPPEPDLPMARQTIDLLEMLQEKTRGNVSDDEAQLLENMLYELRMHFVEAQRKA
jgi:hypothetical protein